MSINGKSVKVTLLVSVFSIVSANVDVSGLFELKYKSGLQKFVPEDYIVQINAPLKNKVDAQLIWKNDAIESYSVGYKMTDCLSLRAGQMLVRFGEFKTHAVSDPFLKADFEKYKPGVNFVFNKGDLELIGGVHNSTKDVTNMYVLRGKYSFNDSLFLGLSGLKDANEKVAYGVFGEVGLWGIAFDGEYVTKGYDNYLAIGLTYPVSDEYELLSRYETAKVGAAEKQAIICGLKVVLDEDLDLFLESVNSDDGSGRTMQFMSKVSYVF